MDTSITGANICGLSGNEYVGVFTMTLSTSNLPKMPFRATIKNSGIYNSPTKPSNEHPYFGIREISVKGSS